MDKIEPPSNLRKQIIFGIAKEEVRRAKRYFIVSASVFPFSIIGVMLAIQYLLQSFYQSGFYHYISLVFSGDSAVYEYWKELSYSLIETLPIFAVIVFLSTLVFLVWSGANTVTNVRRVVFATN